MQCTVQIFSSFRSRPVRGPPRGSSDFQLLRGLGIGRANLRVLPTDERFQLRLDPLREAIEADRARGILPVCIVAMGGSTNTGAVDDLLELRRIADEQRICLHMDAAYGGAELLSRDHPGLLFYSSGAGPPEPPNRTAQAQ